MSTKTAPNGFSSIVPERDAQGLTAAEFMTQQFEYEYCPECTLDAEDHTAVIGPTGSWFAHCNQPEKL